MKNIAEILLNWQLYFKQAQKVFVDLCISRSNHEIDLIVTLFSLSWLCSPNQLLLAFLRPSSERRSERRRPVGGGKARAQWRSAPRSSAGPCSVSLSMAEGK